MEWTRNRLHPGRWLFGFAAFPLAGVAARAAVGPIDGGAAALAGGAITGAIVGLGQALAAGRLLGAPEGWVTATALGYGAGLAAGGSAVGFETDVADLVAMGAVTGIAVGVAQGAALALAGRARAGIAWAAAMPALLALGWAVTSGIGVDVERQHSIFGSSGAIIVTVLGGLLLRRLLATERVADAAASATGDTA